MPVVKKLKLAKKPDSGLNIGSSLIDKTLKADTYKQSYSDLGDMNRSGPGHMRSPSLKAQDEAIAYGDDIS